MDSTDRFVLNFRLPSLVYKLTKVGSQCGILQCVILLESEDIAYQQYHRVAHPYVIFTLELPLVDQNDIFVDEFLLHSL